MNHITKHYYESIAEIPDSVDIPKIKNKIEKLVTKYYHLKEGQMKYKILEGYLQTIDANLCKNFASCSNTYEDMIVFENHGLRNRGFLALFDLAFHHITKINHVFSEFEYYDPMVLGYLDFLAAISYYFEALDVENHKLDNWIERALWCHSLSAKHLGASIQENKLFFDGCQDLYISKRCKSMKQYAFYNTARIYFSCSKWKMVIEKAEMLEDDHPNKKNLIDTAKALLRPVVEPQCQSI